MQCEGLSRLTGLPCRRQAAAGFKYCFLHGGSLPGAKLAAERALAIARLPAIEALYTIVHDWGAEVCQVCGRPNFENAHPVIRAAQIILDRTGFGPKATLEISKQPDVDGLDLELLSPGERDRLASLLGELRQLKAEVRARLAASQGSGEIVDATVVTLLPEHVSAAVDTRPNP